jgi:hypothetical protein
MARFAEISVGTMSELIVYLKSFLTEGNFTLSEESSLDGRTQWVATKGTLGTRFCAVENQSFPAYLNYETSNNSTYWNASNSATKMFTASLGAQPNDYSYGSQSAEFSKKCFFCTGTIPLPCRVHLFELADAALFMSVEIGFNQWRHIYSGKLDTSLAAGTEEIRIFSASTFPAYYSSTYGDHEKRSPNAGMLNSISNIVYWSNSGNSTSFWCVLQNKAEKWNNARTNIRTANEENNTNNYDATAYIAEYAINARTSLPCLYPILFLNEAGKTIYGSVPDIYQTSGKSREGGSEIQYGQYTYRIYPLSDAARSSLAFAVRSN